MRHCARALRGGVQLHSSPPTSGTARTCVPVRETFSGVDLVAGTELRPGPDLTTGRTAVTTTPVRRAGRPTVVRPHTDSGGSYEPSHPLPDPRPRPGIDLRHAGRRPRGRLPGLGRHQLRPRGDGDVRRIHVRRGAPQRRDQAAVGRLPPDGLAQRARSRSASPTTGVGTAGRRWRRPADGRRSSACSSTSWCSVRCATRRRSARSSARSASCSTCRASPCSTSAAPVRQPESVIPDEPLAELPRVRPAVPQEHAVAAGIALAIGLGLAALFRFTRFGLATRAAAGNEKGAILLGYSPAAPGRHQLDHRRRARRHRGDHRRPAAGLAHPDRPHAARRRRPRRRPARRPALDPGRHRRRPRCSAPCRACCSTGRRRTGSRASSAPASARWCRCSSSSSCCSSGARRCPCAARSRRSGLPLSPRPVRVVPARRRVGRRRRRRRVHVPGRRLAHRVRPRP